MMKNIITVAIIALSTTFSFAQTKKATAVATKKKVEKEQIVMASCGQCQFGMKTEKGGCDLAVKLSNEKTYWVSGTSIHDHGDAHAKDGFCNAVRKAKVSGEVIDGRFHTTSFTYVDDKKKESHHGHEHHEGHKH